MKKRWLSAALAVVMAVSVAASQICVYAREATPGNEQVKVQAEENIAPAERSTELTAVSSDGLDYGGGTEPSARRVLEVNYGEKVTLNVTASGGAGELSYQWRMGIVMDMAGAAKSSYGESSYEITVDKDLVRYQFVTCIVSDGVEEKKVEFLFTVRSDLAAVSDVGEDVFGTSTASDTRRVTVLYRKPTVLTVTASGGVGELSYQWLRKEGSLWDLGDYEDIEGATSNRYELVGDEGVSGVYLCRVEDEIGYSRLVKFDVSFSTRLTAVSSDGFKYHTVDISVRPSPYRYVEAVAGEPLSLTVTADSLRGNVSYHWYSKEYEDYDDEAGMNGMEGLTDLGVTDNKITLTENIDGDKSYKYYRCLVTDGIMSKWVYFKTAWHTVRKMSSCKIIIPTYDYYTGKAITPSVKASGPNREEMYEGIHYTLSYKNNKNIGTAKVVITGVGIYRGTVTKYFSIKADQKEVYTVGSYKYKVTGDSTAAIVGVKNKNEQSLTVPDTVKIGGKTFKVTSIADSAFSGCTKLTKAVVGTNVTEIGKNVFKNCKKLGTIDIKSTNLKSAGSNAFKGIKETAKIKVPAKQLKSYKKLLKGKGQGKKVQIVK